MSRLHALSIDLEEWYHPELVRRVAPANPANSAPAATQPLLELLDACGVRATFFVVGELVAACPDLVREIARRDHEIGCHTYSHRPLWELTPATFAAELDACRGVLAEVLGGDGQAAGFRAPTFSLDERTAWALEVLADAGFRYDSSVFPFKNYLYGVAGAPVEPYRISATDLRRPDPAGRLVEFPMTVYRRGRLSVPVSGGVYLRLLPAPLLGWLLRRIARQRSLVLYVHPWEASQSTPRVALPAVPALITYWNRAAMLRKLERLLSQFRFAPLQVVLQQQGLLE